MTEYDAPSPVAFHARVGSLAVSSEHGALTLDVPAFAPARVAADDAPCRALVPDGFVGTFRNFENIFVELESEAQVLAYQPNFPAIAALHPFGLAVTAPGRDVDFVSRYFAPSYVIPEDAVTGSTHATLVPFWAERLGRSSMTALQLSARRGELHVRLAGRRVLLTGYAQTYMTGTMFVPLDRCA